MSPSAPYPAFIELNVFRRRWDSLGLTDEDLHALQLTLGSDANAGDVVPGVPGLRKLRFAAPSQRRGKRDALRVYYANVADAGVIVLAVAFAKSESSDLGIKQRKALAQAVEAVAVQFRTMENE